jgi:hypothetical protein
MSNGQQTAGWVHLLKTISVIVSTTVLIGGLAVGLVLWFSRVQLIPEAVEQHEALRTEFQAADIIIDRKTEITTGQLKEVGRDVKTIKCLIQAPSMKAKAKCGLEP